MLSPEVRELVDVQAVLEMRDRHRSFANITRRIIENAVSRGMLHSGVTQGQLGDAIRLEFEARARRLWEILVELAAPEALARADATALKGLVSQSLESHVDDLKTEHARAVGLMRGHSSVGSLSGFREEALAKVNVEIERRLLLARQSGPSKSDEIFELKPGLWGLRIDLKALWRRLVRQAS